MSQITIPAQVVNGHLQHDKSLTELEGQHVLATLTLVPNGQPAPAPSQPSSDNVNFDPDPPEWLEIENDVYFPISVPSVPLGKLRVRVEKGKPCIILPEDLPNE